MDKLTPPSPSPSGHGDILPLGFDQLIKHNNTSHSGVLSHGQVVKISQPGSRYSSPVPPPRFATPTPQNTYGMDRTVTPVGMNTHGYHTPSHSPQTFQPDWPSTRSGRNFRQTANRVQKPAPKKRTRNKAASTVAGGARTSPVTRPLSELASENIDVEVADIESFVSRSSEARIEELHDAKAKSPGKIKRPMNAFMLYRKAYQNVAKRLCTQNNHQLVSQVCGSSWPLEPIPLRNQFNEWARIERANHQRAHPEYKFTPAKPKPKDDEWNSGSEDGEWRPGRGTSVRWNNNDNNTRASNRLQVVTSDPLAYSMYSPPQNGGVAQGGIGMHGSPPPLYHPYQNHRHDMYGASSQSYYPGGRMLEHGRMARDSSSPAPSFGGDLGNTFDLGNYPPLPGPSGAPFYAPQYGAQMHQHQIQAHQQQNNHHIQQHSMYQGHHFQQPSSMPPLQQQPPRHTQQLTHSQPLIDPSLMGQDEYGDNYALNGAGQAPPPPTMGLTNVMLGEDPSGDYLRGSNEDWQVELDPVDWDKRRE